MRIPRIFLDQELTKNKTYKLDKDSFHHLLVIKKREGDKIEVFNSTGQSLEASISLINKKTCEIFSIGKTKIQEKTFPKISLGISEIKNFEKILNEVTQLGVYRVDCLSSERSKFLKEPSEKKIERWKKVVTGACEQSGNNWMPQIGHKTLDEWQMEIPSKNKFYLNPGENNNIESLSKLDEIYFSIGPEGGFSPKEIDKMKSNGLEGISLGELVIKTETVPTVLLSMLKILNK